MATYVYRCDNCGAQRDWYYPLGLQPRTMDCWDATCDGIARQVITAPAVHVPNGTSAGYVRR